MILRILVIADATTEAVEMASDALKTEDQEHDILMLQGEFANIWRKDHPSNYGLEGITGSPNPVWILKGPEEPGRSLSGLGT